MNTEEDKNKTVNYVDRKYKYKTINSKFININILLVIGTLIFIFFKEVKLDFYLTDVMIFSSFTIISAIILLYNLALIPAKGITLSQLSTLKELMIIFYSIALIDISHLYIYDFIFFEEDYPYEEREGLENALTGLFLIFLKVLSIPLIPILYFAIKQIPFFKKRWISQY